MKSYNFLKLVVLFTEFHFDFGLICYQCTTTLSSSVEESAQLTFRIFLNSAYHLPPVNRFCNIEQDVEFKTIPTIQCSTPNDQCVKIQAKNEGLDFVIRGCKSKIYKPEVTIPQNLDCSTRTSPSICFCKENLCNSANDLKLQISVILAMALLIFSLKY